MKFTINRSHLFTGLSQVLNVVGMKSTMPILANVLVEAADGYVTLTTTNLDIGVRCKIAANVARAGAITLPARRLHGIVRELPALDVVFDATPQSRLKVTSGGSMFNITGISKDEFPPLSDCVDGNRVTMGQDELAGMLRSVAFAQSSDETRYVLNAVFFQFTSGKLVLVATDGRRLAKISNTLGGESSVKGSILLPSKAVGELGRLLGKGTNVTVNFDERKVSFLIDTDKDDELKDGVYLRSKVVEASYPDFSRVIPKEVHQSITINRELFLEAVVRAALVTSEKSNSVKLAFSKGMLEISARGVDVGEALERVLVEYSGPAVEISFNPHFLTSPLSALTKDEVQFEFLDSNSPGVFKTKDGFLCVIMPVRLS